GPAMGDDGPPEKKPPGFEPFPRQSPFISTAVGPLFSRRDGEQLVIGLRVESRHSNSRSWAHGGLLSTVADIALGHAIAAGSGAAVPTTVGIAIDYLSPVPIGSWVEVRTSVLRVGRRLAFSSAELRADGELIARANGTFAMAEDGASIRRGPT
ncbi:MAG: PaaI family thioesterase, partial [Actinobacteria bacterium]